MDKGKKQKKQKRIKNVLINDVSINDLAIAYATGMATKCTYIHIDGYKQDNASLKVSGLQKQKNKGNHQVNGEIEVDVNRPGQDASADFYWIKETFIYDQYRKIGFI